MNGGVLEPYESRYCCLLLPARVTNSRFDDAEPCGVACYDSQHGKNKSLYVPNVHVQQTELRCWKKHRVLQYDKQERSLL